MEFAARVPDQLKIRGGVQKYILKKAVEDLLPREIVYRKKMGFPTPLRQWLLDSARRAAVRRAPIARRFAGRYLNIPKSSR